jgi:hypothetical protein
MASSQKAVEIGLIVFAAPYVASWLPPIARRPASQSATTARARPVPLDDFHDRSSSRD